ncbi:MAG: ATP-binding cassette domain-containing protein [Proteobacteria bacterium]|nr:ATP-binding cassette domain-containing protein [Pseudomonadota bacterium]
MNPSSTRLLRYFELGRSELGIIFAYSLVIGLFSLSIPIAVQNLVNSVAFGSVLLPVFVLTLIVFTGLGVSGLMKIAQRKVVEWLSMKVFYKTTRSLSSVLPAIKEDAFDHACDSTYFSRYLELFSLQKNLSFLIIESLDFILIVGTGMIIVALYHPAFLVFDFLLAGSLYFVFRVVGRDGVATKLEESERKYELSTWIMNLSRPDVALRGRHGLGLSIERTEKLSRAFLECRKNHFAVIVKQHAGFLIISVLASALLLGVGGTLVFRQQLSLGQLVAAEIILAGVLASIGKLDKIVEHYYAIIASISKIESLFEFPLEESASGKHAPGSLTGAWELRGVNYSYPNRNPLWKDLNLEIPAGAKVAVTGKSGAGKSTLLEVLYSLRTPSAGSITLDGISIRDLDLKRIRDRIGYAHHFHPLPESLLSNLTLGKEIPFESIAELAKEIGIDEAIRGLPDGYFTSLETSELPFSDGQLSKLSLLRALLQEPDVLLIDEILDDLDPDAQNRIIRCLMDRTRGKTLLIATHDEAIVRSCTTRLVLPEGTLMEVLK